MPKTKSKNKLIDPGKKLVKFRLKKELINTYGLRLTKKHYPDGISFFDNFFYKANLSIII